MAINKVKVASERAKMKLRGEILTHKVKAEEHRQLAAQKRSNLADLTSGTKK
jgi:hypothetical protein